MLPRIFTWQKHLCPSERNHPLLFSNSKTFIDLLQSMQILILERSIMPKQPNKLNAHSEPDKERILYALDSQLRDAQTRQAITNKSPISRALH